MTPELRAYGVTSLILLATYICFYARYTFWSGDFAWGDRYVSTSVELAALIAGAAAYALSSGLNRERLGKTICLQDAC